MKRLLLYCLLAAAALACTEEKSGEMILNGPMGERFDACMEQWVSQLPYTNPAMTQMYSSARRNGPHPHLMRWYGEFSGKYLTGAALCYTMCPRADVLKAVRSVVDDLGKYQDEDGYLGVWPDSDKLSGYRYDGARTWDLWSHYHNMLGLYYWYKITGDKLAEQIYLKAADCIYRHICTEGNDLADAGITSLAIGHIFAILYEEYGEQKYMDVADTVLKTFEAEKGVDYLRKSLEGVPLYKMPSKRWEGLHAVQMLPELYKITGEENYKTALSNIWRSIADYDRHNTGAFSTKERAYGDPFAEGPIETCCTIAWMALSLDMLELSDNPAVADELELSTWNAFLGAQHPSGRYICYSAPMEGEKKASYMDIGFQSMSGSPELNCCSANFPRGFGMIRQWAVKAEDKLLTINYYGPSTIKGRTPSGKKFTIRQEGGYPFSEDIRLKISGAVQGELRLRIPAWSASTEVTVDGRRVEQVIPGTYLTVKKARTIDIRFDMGAHLWKGAGKQEGRASVYCGPILMTCDQRLTEQWGGELPVFDPSSLQLESGGTPDGPFTPYIVASLEDADGNKLPLCDFASAGQLGTYYTTWIPVSGNAAARVSCFSTPELTGD